MDPPPTQVTAAWRKFAKWLRRADLLAATGPNSQAKMQMVPINAFLFPAHLATIDIVRAPASSDRKQQRDCLRMRAGSDLSIM